MKVSFHEGQKRIWLEIQEAHKKGSRHYVIACPRQFGKTYLFIQLVVYYGTRARSNPMMWVSQYNSNSRKIMEEIIFNLRETDLIASSNKQDMKIVFRNGSVIYFKSADNTKSIRGFSNKILFLDEMAFYPNLDDLWFKILRPTTLRHKDSQVFMISTPNGLNLFSAMNDKGNDPTNKEYSSHTGFYVENPFVDKQEIINAKNDLPEDVYLQEYECKFLAMDASVFKNIDKLSTIEEWELPLFGNSYYAGIDFGKRNDRSVITIMNQDGNVVFIWHSKPGMDYTEQIGEMISVLKRYRVKSAIAESNSMGDPIIDILQKEIRSLRPFFTSQTSKRDLIESLQLAFEECLISIPTDLKYPSLREQLGRFEKKVASTGRISYQAAFGAHDDNVMSLAFCYKCYKDNKQNGQYFVM